MHVKFSCQSELPRLPEISRNKPHLKPWPESLAANSPVSLGRVADGPPDMAGRSAYPMRTVCDLVREHVFTPNTVCYSVRRSDRTVRFLNPDSLPLPVQHPCTHS